MFLAHAPISFLTNEIIQKKRISKLTQNETIFVGIFALLAGILPDLDLFVLQGLDLPVFIHHQIISHTLIFYIALWLIFKLLFALIYKLFSKKTTKFLNKEFLNIILDTFLIGTIVHILADFLVGRIMILYPFSTQGYTIFGSLFDSNLFAGYFFSIAFGIETVICAIFLAYITKSIFRNSIVLKTVNIVIITITTLFLGLNIFSSIKTYKQSTSTNTSANFSYDMDRDFVLDDIDIDTDNDGTDNILDVDIKELVEQVHAIVATSKWTAYDDSSLIAKYKNTYGGFTSYRLISQAYFNLHSPITPVLWNQAIANGDVDYYTDELNNLKTFYDYFNKKEILSSLTSEATVFSNGTIFFILDQQEDVLNVGIVTGNDSVGIVLPYDKRTKIHTFSDVTNYYGNSVAVEFTK